MGEVRVSLAFLLRVPGIADDVRGIDWIHLADDHPGEGMRSAASRCLTVGRELVYSWRSTKVATCKDRWANGQACTVLLADAGGRASVARAVCGDAAADRDAAAYGQLTTNRNAGKLNR